MQPAPLHQAYEGYTRDGFLSGVDIISTEQASAHRTRMEQAEAKLGKLHYLTKIHTILTSPFELATCARALDVVEQLIGPDILLYNSTYIIKEPDASSHVSWHQDLTYWGLNGDDQVSMWLALSPATAETGCMRMAPGSHHDGKRKHELTHDSNNILYQGQTVRDVTEEQAVTCALNPGQASFHHGWTLHSSLPNISNDRRIGLNVQYIAPHMRQTKHDVDTALLVRGVDKFGHFRKDAPAATDLEPAALEHRKELERIYQDTAGKE